MRTVTSSVVFKPLSCESIDLAALKTASNRTGASDRELLQHQTGPRGGPRVEPASKFAQVSPEQVGPVCWMHHACDYRHFREDTVVL